MVKTKEELLAELKEKFGGDNSDSFIETLENVSDTLDDLNTKVEESGDWKTKYNELDEAWKRKYSDRFLSDVDNNMNHPEDNDFEDDEELVTFKDLFE